MNLAILSRSEVAGALQKAIDRGVQTVLNSDDFQSVIARLRQSPEVPAEPPAVTAQTTDAASQGVSSVDQAVVAPAVAGDYGWPGYDPDTQDIQDGGNGLLTVGSKQGYTTSITALQGIHMNLWPDASGRLPDGSAAPGLEGWVNEMETNPNAMQDYWGYRDYLNKTHPGGYEQWLQEYELFRRNVILGENNPLSFGQSGLPIPGGVA